MRFLSASSANGAVFCLLLNTLEREIILSLIMHFAFDREKSPRQFCWFFCFCWINIQIIHWYYTCLKIHPRWNNGHSPEPGSSSMIESKSISLPLRFFSSSNLWNKSLKFCNSVRRASTLTSNLSAFSRTWFNRVRVSSAIWRDFSRLRFTAYFGKKNESF